MNRYFSEAVDRVFKGGSWLAASGFIGHLITLALLPFLTDIYGPEQFGRWAGWVAIVGIISSVASLRLESAVALPKSDVDASYLVGLCVVLTFIISFSSLFVLVFFQILDIPGPWKSLGLAVGFVHLGVLTFAWVNLLNCYMARMGSIKEMGFAKVLSSTVVSIGQLIFGFLGYISVGMLCGEVFGKSIANGYRLNIVRDDLSYDLRRMFKRLKLLFRRYGDHAVWLTPSTLISSLGQRLPVFLLLTWYDEMLTGMFVLVQLLIAAPVSIVGQSISKILLPELSSSINAGERELVSGVIKVFVVLFLSALLIGMLLYFIPDSAFIIFLGLEWATVGKFMDPAILVLIGQLSVSPLSIVLIAVSRQRYLAVWDVMRLVLVFLGMYLGAQMFGIDGAIWGWAISLSGCYVIMLVIIYIELSRIQRNY